jgi:hypothetical protein
MRKKVWMLAQVVLGSLILSTTVLAGPIPPAKKVVDAPLGDQPLATGKWYLRNGAFDEAWDRNVPQSWQAYPGDADAYGPLDFLGSGAASDLLDNAFVFHIVNNKVRGDQNAYLYQEITLPRGDYWINVHSTIYGTGTGIRSWGGEGIPDAYTYMAYYALVPKENVTRDGVFTPHMVGADDWKELWPWSTVCSEKVRGWEASGRPGECDYVKRAETVSVTGGEYVFILRAELKWPDWRAFAYYIFDDLQIISATPFQDNWNACVTSFCLEGLVRRQR